MSQKPPKLEISGARGALTLSQANIIISELVDALDLVMEDKIIEIMFVSSEKMRHINAEHRHIDRPTDVLSFPQMPGPHHQSIWGTIIISPEVAEERAESITELVKHGFLHLAGYDHESAPAAWDEAAAKIKHEMGISCKV